jgi:hypothetical protein
MKMAEVDAPIYLTKTHVIQREYGLHPESKIPLHGKWVYREIWTGKFLDSDRYLNDLVDRHNIQLVRK